MNDIPFDCIKDYKDDTYSFEKYKNKVKLRLGVSLLSGLLSFIFIFIILYTEGHLASILIFVALATVCLLLQRLPKIKCINCSCYYSYFNVIEGVDVVIYGVCHHCGTKMNTEIPLTSA